MKIKHLGMKFSVAILFCVLLVTYGFYWKGIGQLHYSVIELLEVSDHLKNGDSFHSAIHSMLINAQRFVDKGGSSEFHKKYLEQLNKASQSLKALQYHVARSGTNTTEDYVKTSTQGIVQGFVMFRKELDAVFQLTSKEQQKHLTSAQALFDSIFNKYYVHLHDHHAMLQNKLRESTDDTWQTATTFFGIQFAIAVIAGLLVIIYLDRVVLKIFSFTERMAFRDRLTGLYNRAALDKLIKEQESTDVKERRRYSLIMLDIDHFKNFNDTFGHQAGDHLLSELANLLVGNVRGHDYVFRYGGEEFLVYLAGEDRQGALVVAEKLRTAIENKSFHLPDKSIAPKVTASLGVASQPWDGNNFSEVLRNADLRLYAAKKAGRNRVVGSDALAEQ